MTPTILAFAVLAVASATAVGLGDYQTERPVLFENPDQDADRRQLGK
ncbi:hypothetical protein [Ktedonobacter racemifer]|uniref:Uncharacterized protein n=1 Tax=Ktedonobacter racemifer DSM 44963 TaxID=485913 RepID=D6TQN8_KTERA|nr:hypothetical protein [Ktedonobacter racemifer]EFH87705.1 hypothetical protein Krac_9050 [Ktedonobacter racemifer DSM 44963]